MGDSDLVWIVNYHRDLQAVEYRLKELTQVLMEIASKVG